MSLLYLFWALGNAPPSLLENLWITSDTLYPVNVTTDIFQDGYSLSGWRFSIAPCWFPDLFTTGVFWVLVRNPILATLLAGFVQLALIIGAFGVIRRAVGMRGEGQTVVLLGVSVGITLYVAAHPGLNYPDLYRFFLPQSHVGGLILSLYAFGLGLLLLCRISWMPVAGYVVLCFLAGMSNLMFFPQMLGPFTAALALAVFFGVLPWSGSWMPVAVGWSAAIAGAVVNRALLHATDVSAQSQISRDGALAALDVFARGMAGHLGELLHVLAAVWLLACFTVVAVILRRLTASRPVSQAQRLLFVFAACWLLSSVICAAAVVLGGSIGLTVFKDYIWTTHYLQSVFFMPLFGLPLLAVWLVPLPGEGITRAARWAGAVLWIAVPAVCLMGSRPNSGITSYRPALVQSLDLLAAQRGIRYGLAGYWQARVITLLSRQGLRAYAVDGNMDPFLWVDNADWYRQSLDDRRQKPVWKFVVLDDPAFKLSREAALARFGKPSEELRVDPVRVLLY